MMKTESPVSADIDNSRCGGSAKSILSRPFGVVRIRQWTLFYRCFVLVRCWGFVACCHIRFSPVHPFHFSFNTTRPQITKQKAHDEIRKVFGQQVSSENHVCSSLSDIFCRLQCNNLPKELNPVRDTGSIRRKDPWQMATEQKTNAQCKQFILRMITARHETREVTCWKEFVQSTKFASLSNVRIEPKIDPKYKTTSHYFYIKLLVKELSKHCPISSSTQTAFITVHLGRGTLIFIFCNYILHFIMGDLSYRPTQKIKIVICLAETLPVGQL
jgi:hypothetical protein